MPAQKMGSYDSTPAVGALRYAQTTRVAPTATRPAAVSSASRPLGTTGTLDGLSSRTSGVTSRAAETGLRDMRIGKPTYEVARLGLPYAALPTPGLGP
jgi:hypothetical protein